LPRAPREQKLTARNEPRPKGHGITLLVSSRVLSCRVRLEGRGIKPLNSSVELVNEPHTGRRCGKSHLSHLCENNECSAQHRERFPTRPLMRKKYPQISGSAPGDPLIMEERRWLVAHPFARCFCGLRSILFGKLLLHPRLRV
jgi:hypothetical protein